MSVARFGALVAGTKLNDADKKWFPRWLRSYASSLKITEGDIRVTEAEVIAFSRSLRDSKTPAWQRLQAVRAIEAYRDLVLRSDEPSLQTIRQTLSRIADQERADGSGADRPGIEDERHLIGWIDPAEPEIIQQVRRELRVRRRALETERAYVGWVERFVEYTGCSDVTRLAECEIKAFLTHLAVDENVAPKTQGQAKSALLFLFQEVLGRELGFLNAQQSTKASRLPVVLSRREIELVYPEFQGLRRLMFLVMYGAGLRHRECRRLRVKDV
jgi:integrase